MAKRKSLNKRLSRYSRSSAGSAILDPDTDVLGDEHPYWWKRLENNTITRPSMSSELFNQTSRQLDSDTLIETDTVEDGWWKVLEATDVSKSSNVTKYSLRKDAFNYSSVTSESEEEPRITKKKYSLRSKARNSQDNAFSNAMDSSKSINRSKSVENISGNSSVSTDITNVKTKLKEVQENSLNQNQTTDNILKLKPTFVKKNYKRKKRNIFDDILQEDKLQSSSTTLKTDSNHEQPVTADSPIMKRSRFSQLSISVDNIHNLYIPNAQSTLLGSDISDSLSQADTIVMKPRSKFLKNHNRPTKGNISKNVFMEEEVDVSEETNKSKKSIIKESKSMKTSLISPGNDLNTIALKVVGNVVMENKTSDAKTTTELHSAEKKNSTDSNSFIEASIASSDISNITQSPTDLPKSESTVSTRPHNNSKRNLFSDILENNTNSNDAFESKAVFNRTKKIKSTNKNCISSPKIRKQSIVSEGSSSMENLHMITTSSSKKVTNDIINNTGKQNTDLHHHSKLSRTLDQENVSSSQSVNGEDEALTDSAISLIESLGGTVKEQSNVNINEGLNIIISNICSLQNSVSSNENEHTESEKNYNISKQQNVSSVNNDTVKQTKNLCDSQKLSTLRLERNLHIEEDENIPKKRSRNLNMSHKQSVSVTANEEDHSKVDNNITRQSRNLSKSQQLSRLHITSDSDEEDEIIPRLQSRIISKSHKQSMSVTARKIDQVDVDNSTTRENSNLSKSQKLSILPIASDSDKDDNEIIPKVQSQVINKSHKQSVSVTANEIDHTMVDNNITSDSDKEDEIISRSQNQIMSKSHKQSMSVTAREIDQVDVDNSITRKNSDLSKSQKLSTLPIASDSNKDDNEIIPKVQSRIMSKSQLNSVRMRKIDEVNFDYNNSRQITNLSKSQNLSTSFVVSNSNNKYENILKKQPHVVLTRLPSESVAVNVQNQGIIDKIVTRHRKNLQSTLISNNNELSESDILSNPKGENRMVVKITEISSLPPLNEVESVQDESTMKRRNSRMSRSQSHSIINTGSKYEVDKVQSLLEKESKNLNLSKKKSVSFIAEEAEPNEIDNSTNKQRKKISTLQNQSSVDIREESEAEEVQTLLEQSYRSENRSQNQMVAADVNEIEPNKDKNSIEEQNKESNLQEQMTVLNTNELSLSKYQDDTDFQNKSLNSLSKTIKQINVPYTRKEQFVFDSNIPNNEEDAHVSNATRKDVNEAETPNLSYSSNKVVIDKFRKTNKDTHTLSRRSMANDSHNFRTTAQNVPQNLKVSSIAKNLVTSLKISSNRATVASSSQRNIEDFFHVENSVPASQVLNDKEKMAEIKMKMANLKQREIDNMNASQRNHELKMQSQAEKAKILAKKKKKKSAGMEQHVKEVHKAYLVNGNVYKVPRLVRPKPWITNRLYKYLWKCMESKFKLDTRLVSEKFVRELSDVTTLIMKQKSYINYKYQLHMLMKEMARLGIIENRNDFYHFCYDFFPYDLRLKTVPMLLPGKTRNIPYESDKLFEPILKDT